MERTRKDQSREEEEALIQRMKDECNQALAKQWKLANEKLTLVKKNEIRFIIKLILILKKMFRQLNKLKND